MLITHLFIPPFGKGGCPGSKHNEDEVDAHFDDPEGVQRAGLLKAEH